jgi:hypothetical protein
MGLRINRSQPVKRIFGILLGLGFIAVGLFTLFGGGDLTGVVAERAFGFGITALIVGVIAVGLTLFADNLDNIWCSPPRRWF